MTHDIFLVTPDHAVSDNFVCLTDSEVIDLDINEVKFSRPNWIYQQLIKTFQDVTRNDLYMCIDQLKSSLEGNQTSLLVIEINTISHILV